MHETDSANKKNKLIHGIQATQTREQTPRQQVQLPTKDSTPIQDLHQEEKTIRRDQKYHFRPHYHQTHLHKLKKHPPIIV